VLGRDTIPETDMFSTCCAVQNLWLAARAEGLAVGWVSILHPDELKQTLKIPGHIFPVAYLCIGHTKTFYDKPMLETVGWAKRLKLEDLIFYDKWQGAPNKYSIKLNNE
jgi:5,6-dimethylbenzimidazole synthase